MKYSIAFVCIALVGQAFADCTSERHPQQYIAGCCGDPTMKLICRPGGSGCDPIGSTKICGGCTTFQAKSCTASSPAVAQETPPILKEEITFQEYSTCGATSLRALEQWLNAHPYTKQDRQIRAELN